MIAALLLALGAPAASADAAACIPAATQDGVLTAVNEHRTLRETLGEPMPKAATMVMLFGRGGHLSTSEYSIVLARRADGRWDGTAVGRSQTWIKDAPFNPMNRREWTLDQEKSRALDAAIVRRCPAARAVDDGDSANRMPDHMGERIDLIRPCAPVITFRPADANGGLDGLLRPPAYR